MSARVLTRLQNSRRETRGQQHRMPMLQREMNRRIAILKQTLDVREREGFQPARRLVESNLGLDTMRAVTALIDQVSNSETALLQQRLTDLAHTQQVLNGAAETDWAHASRHDGWRGSDLARLARTRTRAN